MNKTILMSGVLMVSLVLPLAGAQELYKWVDSEGVTHYGDALPDSHIQHKAFEFADYRSSPSSPSSSPTENYYSIQNQLQRLQDSRAESLKQKQQVADIRAAKRPPPTQEVYVSSDGGSRYYAPAYLPYSLGGSDNLYRGRRAGRIGNERHLGHHDRHPRRAQHSRIKNRHALRTGARTTGLPSLRIPLDRPRAGYSASR